MTNVLTRKLQIFGRLQQEDRDLLDALVGEAVGIGPRQDLIREGETPDHVHLIVEGFACRYKLLANGKRQNMAYLIPGDFCDLHVFILKSMDHTIATLSRCLVTRISRGRILELFQRPALARALWWATLVDEATLREWLVNIGARPGDQRVAHLLCELLVRLQSIGLANGNAFELPLTQTDIAETMGLSNVHVNRVLQHLRAEGLITFKSKHLVILDADRLKQFSGFTANYLHLDKPAHLSGGR